MKLFFVFVLFFVCCNVPVQEPTVVDVGTEEPITPILPPEYILNEVQRAIVEYESLVMSIDFEGQILDTLNEGSFKEAIAEALQVQELMILDDIQSDILMMMQEYEVSNDQLSASNLSKKQRDSLNDFRRTILDELQIGTDKHNYLSEKFESKEYVGTPLEKLSGIVEFNKNSLYFTYRQLLSIDGMDLKFTYLVEERWNGYRVLGKL